MTSLYDERDRYRQLPSIDSTMLAIVLQVIALQIEQYAEALDDEITGEMHECYKTAASIVRNFTL